jgi:putative ABC transport system permease protein
VNIPLQISQALANITSAKMRSFLAILGILVGTASVVALVTSGELATKKALDQFKALGTDLLSVTFNERQSSNTQTPANTISIKELWLMKDEIESIVNIAPYTSLYANMSFSGKKIEGDIIGANDSLEKVIKIQLQSGEFVSYLEKYEKVCVIGQKILKQIRQTTLDNPIGKQLKLGANFYTIVGITKHWPENSFFNGDINNAVIIPLAGSNLISKQAKIRNAVVLLKEKTPIQPVVAEIKKFVSQHAPDLTIFTRSPEEIIKSMQSQGKIFTMMLGMIGGISLLVGGIGVMNVMLVSVTERRREIGIRKAIGAKRRDIQLLFLIESIVLSLFGGFLGVIVGLFASYVIAYFSHWDFTLFIEPPIIGFAVSVATGIFFGFYPAHRASRLDPIETLRYD